MKKWPLRWKIASYAAGLGVVATLAGASTTWLVMRFSEIASLDRRLTGEAAEIYRAIASVEDRKPAIQAKLVGLAARDRLLELRGPNGSLLYASPRLEGTSLADGIDKPHRRNLGGQNYRLGSFHQNGYTLHIAADLAEIDRLGFDIVLGMFAAIPTVLLVVTLGGRWVARQALGPIEAIRAAAAKITIQNLDQRLPVPTAKDEIAGLIAVLNGTLDRLQRSFEQSVRFSADASHQLKTPISVLRAGIEEILTDPATPQRQQVRAEALLHQLHKLTSIAENLLLLARADAGRLGLRPQQFNLREVLDGVCDDARALAEPYELTIDTDVPAELLVVADRASVELIAQNLVENAVKYNQRGGAICIRARHTDGEVEVTFGNNGEGIAHDRRANIFERFYRARGDGRVEGQGLGLSIARELARAHGGDIALLRTDADWTEFSLRLPRATKQTFESGAS
jgi:two-component system, OmpR family, heavy metal sensor histidine kinase CusS